MLSTPSPLRSPGLLSFDRKAIFQCLYGGIDDANDPVRPMFPAPVICIREAMEQCIQLISNGRRHGRGGAVYRWQGNPASCITFLSEQAFAPQNTRFWIRRRVWFQFTVGEDKPPMLSVDNRGKGVLSMDCSAKRSPL